MILSLAGLRYRNVLAAQGGPIARVDLSTIQVGREKWFQASAALNSNLAGNRDFSVYSNKADGTGAHPLRTVATHIAVSEAMERWAYRQTVFSERAADYGFDIDPSSNGMAAFPGLLARQARRTAHLEGIERFWLFAWWEGHVDGQIMDTDWPGVKALIFSPPDGGFLALVFGRTALGNYAYGHAAHESLTTAITKAMVEMNRHDRVVRRYYAEGNGASAPTQLLEKRALFFASEAGHEMFQARLGRPRWKQELKFEIICDREIKGPWSQYATVWRSAARPPSDRFVRDDETYFFW